jgi:hypothetical protein
MLVHCNLSDRLGRWAIEATIALRERPENYLRAPMQRPSGIELMDRARASAGGDLIS